MSHAALDVLDNVGMATAIPILVEPHGVSGVGGDRAAGGATAPSHAKSSTRRHLPLLAIGPAFQALRALQA